MKTFIRFLSYVITALAAATLTMVLMLHFVMPKQGKLSELEALIRTCFIGEYDETLAEDAAASAMIYALGDRWSYYIPAASYESVIEQSENAYVGVGITITAEDGKIIIISVQTGGSAEEAGILPGDILVTADGKSTEGMTIDDLRNIIRGEEGTNVTVGTERDGVVTEYSLERRQILAEIVQTQMLDGHIGMVKILNFDSRAAQDSIAAIESLIAQGAEAFLFDVRCNNGGYADELVALLDYLLPEGDLFHSVDFLGREQTDKSDAAFLDYPMAVLCNGESYSAAEFFAAAIREYDAGTVIGTPTVGKGYFQAVMPLSDGSAVGLSIGKYFTPNGNSLIDVGLVPDILLEVDDETYRGIRYSTLAPEDDPQVQAAVEVLLEQIR